MTPDQVTNQVFMQAMFPSAGADAFNWVCSFHGDPTAVGSRDWLGQSCRANQLPRLDDSGNTFFNISTLKPHDGRVSRKSENFDALWVIVLDDVGTKATLPPSAKPTYLIETSAGNFQAGFRLAEPLRSMSKAKAIFKALAAMGFTDAGAQGPQSRYVRLPVGVNLKTKCGPDGFRHRLTLWNPESTATVDELVSMFGLELEEFEPDSASLVVVKPRTATESVADELIVSKVLRSPKARRVWNGEGGYEVGTGSEADLYLLICIAFSTESAEQVERIYSGSPRAGRRSSDGTYKWLKRPDYRKVSIESAFRFVEAHPNGNADDARATVEAAVAVAKASGNISGVYAPEVLEAFSILEKADPGNFDHLRSVVKKAGVTMSRLDAEIVKAGDTGARLFDADAADQAIHILGGVDSVIFTSGQFWRWRQELGIWIRLDGDEPIKQVIMGVLPKRQVTGGGIGSVLSVLRTKVARKVEFDKGYGAYSVNCANGTLVLADSFSDVLDGDGEVWKLRPHRREDYFTSLVPHAWVPHTPCPVFDRFLASIVDGDADAEDKVALLEQAVGYSITTATDQEKFFILLGPSDNGKSTFLAVLEACAGAENTAAISLKQLGERFPLAKLHGKLVNLCSEISRGDVLPDDHIKKLTSGDVISAEFKGRDHFEFRNKATLWFACNEAPNLRDLTQATLEKRCVLIELNRSFKGHERDVGLKGKLLAESQGIFWKCVQHAGVSALMSQSPIGGAAAVADGTSPGFFGGFLVEPPSSIAAKAVWRAASDPVELFAADRLAFGSELFVESTELFAAWDEWATSHGVTLKLTSHHLTARLKRLHPRIKTGDDARRGRLRGIAGLGLVDL